MGEERAEREFIKEAKARFGFKGTLQMPKSLVVVEVDGPFMVHVYDSAESVLCLGNKRRPHCRGQGVR